MPGSGALRISHFRVEEQLRRDELGYFFRAVDEQLDRPVVLRVVRALQAMPDVAPGPIRSRIRSNAKAAAHVSHPNLVTIHEFRALSETDIIVMELAEGPTLEESFIEGRRWTVVEVARMLARLGDALAAAHDAGLVHGNVNAANVRVRADGRIRLLDLGIPKFDSIEDTVPHDPSDDVRGLARIAVDLLGPPPDLAMPAESAGDLLSDTVASRARFGFLAPVLRMAVRDTRGFANGAAFRDAVLQAMEMATGRPGQAGEFERGFATHVLGPEAAVAVEDTLPADAATLEPMTRAAGGTRGGGPRLVLPPDLAERAPAGSFNPENFRLALRAQPRLPRFRGRTGPGIVIAALLLVAIGIAAGVILFRLAGPQPASGDAPDPVATIDEAGAESGAALDSTTELAASTNAAVTPPAGGALSADVVGADDTVAAADAPAPELPVFSAVVRASPSGTRIRAVDGDGGPWESGSEIGVVAGDTIRLEFSHPGYITQRRSFTGSRMSIALDPDSAIARFRANISADVFIRTGSGDRRLGTANVDVRLPTGTHRIVFRSPGQPDWETTVAMNQAGATYDVTKADYATTGTLVAAVSGSWARVSVDGGPARETPARFESLPVGRHVVTLTRAGFATVVDTVIVSATGITRRTYTMRR